MENTLLWVIWVIYTVVSLKNSARLKKPIAFNSKNLIKSQLLMVTGQAVYGATLEGMSKFTNYALALSFGIVLGVVVCGRKKLKPSSKGFSFQFMHQGMVINSLLMSFVQLFVILNGTVPTLIFIVSIVSTGYNLGKSLRMVSHYKRYIKVLASFILVSISFFIPSYKAIAEDGVTKWKVTEVKLIEDKRSKDIIELSKGKKSGFAQELESLKEITIDKSSNTMDFNNEEESNSYGFKNLQFKMDGNNIKSTYQIETAGPEITSGNNNKKTPLNIKIYTVDVVINGDNLSGTYTETLQWPSNPSFNGYVKVRFKAKNVLTQAKNGGPITPKEAATAGGVLLLFTLGGALTMGKGTPLSENIADNTSKDAQSDNGDEKKRRYWVETRIRDQEIRAGTKDVAWVYARVFCDDAKVNTTSLTQKLKFELTNEKTGLLKMGKPQWSNDWLAININASSPDNKGILTTIRKVNSLSSTGGGNYLENVLVTVKTPEITAKTQIGITVIVEGNTQIEMQTYEGKTSIRLDGKDGLWLYARAIGNEDNGEEVSVLNKLLSFNVEGEYSNYVEIFKPTPIDGWMAVYVRGIVQENEPNGVVNCSIKASVHYENQYIEKSIELQLIPQPKLKIMPEKIIFTPSKCEKTIEALVEGGENSSWNFIAEGAQGNGWQVDTEIQNELPNKAVLNIVASKSIEDDVIGYKELALRVQATCDNIVVEKEITLLMVHPGLEIRELAANSENLLVADGKSTLEIECGVYILDEVKNDLVSSGELASNLKFETFIEDETAINALKGAEFNLWFERFKNNNQVTAVYAFSFKNEIPADGRVMPVKFRISVPGIEDESFSKEWVLNIKTMDIGPFSNEWQEEMRKTEEFINRFIPEKNREEFLNLLTNKKYVLGAPGLYTLRHKMWDVAQSYILAEGLSYEADAAFYEQCKIVSEWVKWLSEQTFNMVAQYSIGGFALGACITKDLIAEAIVAWYEGKSLEKYIRERFESVLQGGIEYCISPENFKMKFGLAWATGAYFLYKFVWNLGFVKNDEGRSMSAFEAAKAAVEETTVNAVENWINDYAEKIAKERGWKPENESSSNNEVDAKKTTEKSTEGPPKAPEMPKEKPIDLPKKTTEAMDDLDAKLRRRVEIKEKLGKYENNKEFEEKFKEFKESIEKDKSSFSERAIEKNNKLSEDMIEKNKKLSEDMLRKNKENSEKISENYKKFQEDIAKKSQSNNKDK